MNKIARIEIKRELCIGAGPCLALAPETFELDDENIAVLINPKGLPAGEAGNSDIDILAAAKACPTLAIYIYDDAGNQLWPT
jgi:ferredoxin